jgi:hypothetical protein
MVLDSVRLKPDSCFDGLDESSPTDLGCWQATYTPCGIKRLQQLPRKEVIQPQLPLRLPCYDFAPVIDPTLGACLLAVSPATSGVTDSHSVTGGVYKARERIHRRVLTGSY